MPSRYNCTGCNAVFDTKPERKHHFRNVCQTLVSVTDAVGKIHQIERASGKFTCPRCPITGLVGGEVSAQVRLVLFCVCFSGVPGPHSGEGPPIAERVKTGYASRL